MSSVVGFGRKRRGAFTTGALTLFVAVVVIGLPSRVEAHDLQRCGGGIRWPDAAQTYARPSTWGPTTRAAVDGGHNAITNATDFNFSRATVGRIPWSDYGSPNENIAGIADVTAQCSGNAPFPINGVALFLNFPHFNSPHSLAEIQCVTVHEAGHGIGLDHNTVNFSMMNPEHGAKCHDGSPISTPLSHDVGDINAKY